MDLRNIIKEAVNDFEWTEEIPSRLNTYRVTYITELYIDAHDEDEANEIYEDMNLWSLRGHMMHYDDQVGLKDYQFIELNYNSQNYATWLELIQKNNLRLNDTIKVNDDHPNLESHKWLSEYLYHKII